MPRPRQQKLSQVEIAEMVGVAVKTLRVWAKEEGLNLGDLEAVKARAAAVVSKDETLADARRRRAVASADAEEIRVRRMKGELIETRIPRGVITGLDQALCVVWKQAPNELTGLLYGLSGGPMRDAIITWIDGTLIPRFAQKVAEGIATMDASFSEIRKVLPKQAP